MRETIKDPFTCIGEGAWIVNFQYWSACRNEDLSAGDEAIVCLRTAERACGIGNILVERGLVC